MMHNSGEIAPRECGCMSACCLTIEYKNDSAVGWVSRRRNPPFSVRERWWVTAAPNPPYETAPKPRSSPSRHGTNRRFRSRSSGLCRHGR